MTQVEIRQLRTVDPSDPLNTLLVTTATINDGDAIHRIQARVVINPDDWDKTSRDAIASIVERAFLLGKAK